MPGKMCQPIFKRVRHITPLLMLSCAIGLVHFPRAQAARFTTAIVTMHGNGAVAQILDEQSAATLHHIASRVGEAFAVEDIAGNPGEAIPVNITLPPHQSDDYLLLSFRGLPKKFRLTSGFGTAEAWFVSARDVAELQILPPKDFVGFFELQVQLVRGPDIKPETISTKVAVGLADPALSAEPVRSITQTPIEPPAEAPADQLPSLQPSEEAPVASLPAVSVDPQEEERMLLMAEDLLRQNDIPAARLIYGRLARQGSRNGAMMMAQSHDPAFLGDYDIAGLSADREKAKFWYNIAAQLGSPDASQRLLALDSKN